MATVQTIHNLLATNGATTANTLKAVRNAIFDSWPHIKLAKYNASAATLSTATFDYSLSAITNLMPEYGPGRVFVAPDTATDGPEIGQRQYRTYRDSSNNWHLVFDAEVISLHNGNLVAIAYWTRTPDMTDPASLGEDVDLPLNYLTHYCDWWYAVHGLTMPESGRGYYETRLVEMRNAWQNALKANATMGSLQSPYSVGRDKMHGRDRTVT